VPTLPAASHRRARDNRKRCSDTPDGADEKLAEGCRKAAARLFSKTIRPIACGFS
jgi:hypothetical protein